MGIAVVVVAIVNGVVKKWIHHRGFGFITTETSAIFCHVTALKTGTYSLAVGDSVTFDVDDSDRKPGSKMAKNVRRVE